MYTLIRAWVLVGVGLFLVIHDVLYHLGAKKMTIGKPSEIKSIRIHHAYLGAILVFLGVFLIFYG